MPEKFFLNGAAWEYFVNRNLGFGILWQEWSKAGGKDFDPVMTTQRDDSGDTAANPYARQPSDTTYIDNASLMAGLAVEYLADTGTRIGGEIRYHNARNDTTDYTEYMNLGSTQVIFYIQFMLKPLGML